MSMCRRSIRARAASAPRKSAPSCSARQRLRSRRRRPRRAERRDRSTETKRAAPVSGAFYFVVCKRSGAAAPQSAVAPRYERQAVGIARHARVLLQLELLLGLVPALAGLAELLHLRRG